MDARLLPATYVGVLLDGRPHVGCFAETCDVNGFVQVV